MSLSQPNTVPILHIGITGTRNRLTMNQYESLALTLAEYSAGQQSLGSYLFIHHGCCIGTDEISHLLARDMKCTFICGHPGIDRHGNSPYSMPIRLREFSILNGSKPYRERNKDIVNTGRIIIACPASPEMHFDSRRSGTWQTVRLARKAEKEIIYIWADGSVTHERDE
jgi:hypothetical protein